MKAVDCSCTPRRARSAPDARAGSRSEPRPNRTWPSAALQDLDEGRLAGAVGAEQADDLSGSGDREIDAAQRVNCLPTVALAKVGAMNS
jgi:hypothetical protein